MSFVPAVSEVGVCSQLPRELCGGSVSSDPLKGKEKEIISVKQQLLENLPQLCKTPSAPKPDTGVFQGSADSAAP